MSQSHTDVQQKRRVCLPAVYLPRRRPMVRLAGVPDADEDVAQFNAGAQYAPQQQNTAASSEPAQHRDFKRDLLVVIDHADTKKRGMWFSCDAMNFLPKLCVHPVVLDSRSRDLGLDTTFDWHVAADRTETWYDTSKASKESTRSVRLKIK
eukprot:5279452-Prymnesium_polylepis.2